MTSKKAGKDIDEVAREIIAKTDIADVASDDPQKWNNLSFKLIDSMTLRDLNKLRNAIAPGWRKSHRDNKALYDKIFKKVGVLARDYADSWVPQNTANIGAWFALGFATLVQTVCPYEPVPARMSKNINKAKRQITVIQLARMIVKRFGIAFYPAADFERLNGFTCFLQMMSGTDLQLAPNLEQLKDLISSKWRESKAEEKALHEKILKKTPLVDEYCLDPEGIEKNIIYYTLGFESAKRLIGM
jgi:hypothetical protein